MLSVIPARSKLIYGTRNILTGGHGTEIVEIALLGAIVGLASVLGIWALITSVVVIQEYELGVLMVLGRYKRNLGPGLHLVTPFLSRIYRVDTRVQTLDLGRHEIMTRDLSPTVIEATVQYRLEEPQKSLLKYDKFRSSLSQIAHSTLRKLTFEYDLEELFRSQIRINERYKKALDAEFSNMGLVVVRTEIREIDPVGPVKSAIEDRIAAEKERQAMILRADGRRKAILMEAEANRSAKDI